MNKKKKGVSPVIATVLLIAMVIVIAFIMFLWFQGMGKESVEKFGKNIALACDDIQLDASYDSGKLRISNKGNVPIYKVDIIEYSPGTHKTLDIVEDANMNNWPDKGLNAGQVFSGSYNLPSDVDKIELVPVLIGESKGTQKRHLCEEQAYEINLPRMP